MTKIVRKVNTVAQAHMIKLLLDGPANCNEIAEHTGLHRVTVSEYMRALHRVGAAHIHMYEKDGLGRDSIKVYALGPGKDAKRARLSSVARSQRNRDRKRQAQELAVAAGRGRFVQSGNGRLRFEPISA